MKITFVTSVFGNDIGGPAIFSRNLARALGALGVLSRVVQFPRLPKGVREIVYFVFLFLGIPRCDIMYSLSGSPAVNLPIVFLNFIFRKKIIMRPGGDFLWERAVEDGSTEKTLGEYYKSGGYKKRRVSLLLFSFCLRNADKIIFPTQYLKNLYRTYFCISENKSAVIDYPFPDISEELFNVQRGDVRQFIFAGRLIKFKNLERLIRAFAGLDRKAGVTLKIVGGGPEREKLHRLAADLGAKDFIYFKDTLPHNELLAELRRSYCAIIPSIFEPGSFFMLECLKLKVPVICTKESGLYNVYKDTLIFLDPYLILDIKEKLKWLLDEANYKVYAAKIAHVDTKRSWNDAASEHRIVFQKLMGRKNKRVLFIGVSDYDLTKDNAHLAKKFEGLSREFDVISIARGRPFRKRKWNCEFYLIKHRSIFLPVALVLGFYLCASKKIDIIVCQSPLTEGVIGVILKKVFGKELVIEAHGDWEEMPLLSRKRKFEGLVKKIIPSIARLSFRNADKIRTLTKFFAERIKKIAPEKKYFIFPTYTDIDYFLEEADTSFKKYILTVGVLSPIKNIETLIDAFARIHKEFPDFKLVIAGDGLSLGNLKLKVKNEKSENVVIFTGRLSQEEVREAMKDCYLFVLPSLNEGFGRVLLEAMALSKPVIGSNVGGIPEIVKDGENGFLIDPKDVTALAGKMKVLLANKIMAEGMGKKGREFCKTNFSNGKYIENFTKLIYS